MTKNAKNCINALVLLAGSKTLYSAIKQYYFQWEITEQNNSTYKKNLVVNSIARRKK